MELGLIGKHPGYGDFLAHNVSDEVQTSLSGWMDTTLSQLRDQMGDAWPAFWEAGQSLRFWIGRGVLGRTVAGLFIPSQDKVGRRYPLALLAEGVALPAPVNAPDQQFFEAIERHVATMKAGDGAAALLGGLSVEAEPEDEAQQAEGPVLWAHRPDGDLDKLLAAAGPVDAARGLTSRSYWWAPGREERAAVWMGHPGLPGPQALGWLIGGVPLEEAQNGEQ